MMQTVEYGSCYVYSPMGRGHTCERSRLLRDFLKAGDAGFMIRYALQVSQEAQDSLQLRGFFASTDLLVPVPGSMPFVTGRLWAAESLAAARVAQGLGQAAWPGLRRSRAVHKSATAAPGTRPTVDLHYDSFLIEPLLRPPRSIILVDDVVTKGRTLLAAASRVQEAFPETRVRAFALLRTMGRVAGLRRLIDPCTGQIDWRRGDAHRYP